MIFFKSSDKGAFSMPEEMQKSIKGTLLSMFRPGMYFDSGDISARRIFIETAALIILLYIPVVISGFIMFDEINTAIHALNKAARSVTASYAFRSPYGFLLFPVFWILYISIVWPVRYLATVFLGEQTRSLTLTGAIGAVAVRPLIFIAAVFRTLNNFLTPGPDTQTGRMILLVTVLSLFVISWIWEGFICISGFRKRFHQNFGRALLTWISPLFFAILGMWLLATIAWMT